MECTRLWRRLQEACSSFRHPPPDEAAKLKLREQAHDWLKAELAAWSRVLEVQPAARTAIAQILLYWKQDSDLALIREAEAMEKLPVAERQGWESLWAEVDRLLTGASPPSR